MQRLGRLGPRVVLGSLLLALTGGGCSSPTVTHTGGSGEGEPSTTGSGTRPTGREALVPFGSKAELVSFLESQKDKTQRRGKGEAPLEEASPAPAAEAAADGGGESITNVQTAGVDEGGIVKTHGDHLVVLRRGRLFTVRLGSSGMTPVSAVDAFGPDVDPQGAWYDEMLVAKNTVVVIGYSYARGGTEVGLFDIDGSGNLAYRSTYHLRSNDYYSSRNYASRLIGDKLVFYSPLYLNPFAKDVEDTLPAVRKWSKGAKESDFATIIEPAKIYRPLDVADHLALHTVTTCDLSKRDMDCSATAVMGPAGRSFYVSKDSVYVWMTPWSRGADGKPRAPGAPKSLLYKLSLEGADPSVLRVRGAPVDQFSFLEAADETINVVVRSDGSGDAMWAPEKESHGAVALLRVSLATFSKAADEAPEAAYTKLPSPAQGAFQNRFVGDHLLYGAGAGWGAPKESAREVFVHRYADKGGEPARLALTHAVDRIEAIGRDAVVIGSDGKDLHFSSVRLTSKPSVAGDFVQPGASQGEVRSHGFFYKPDSNESGLLGLPIRGGGDAGYEHLRAGSASILFVRNERLGLTEVGKLRSETVNANDGCKASCVDWYGNARPIFAKGRVFALLGYELVEGKWDGASITEVGRVDFAPRSR